MKTIVWVETKEEKPVKAGLELIQAAGELGEVNAVVWNDPQGAKATAAYGVRVVSYTSEAKSVYGVVEALAQEAKDADAVLLPASLTGKDVTGRLAGKLNEGAVSDVVGISVKDGNPVLRRPLFGGTVFEDVRFKDGKKIIVNVRSGSFSAASVKDGGSVEEKTISITEPVEESGRAKEITEEVNLEDADIVVAGGRGCSDPEVFKLVEQLAKELGGVVGASRPAIEAGLVSRAHQVGQSGKNIAPKLYIACGISGAMQHISGIANADYIVAINKDEDAPIFSIADIGIVGKVEDILPIMIRKIQERKNG